eukprot:m.65155 g.65155  ORF g.65155 m.65155 type:complete len:256 (-) comp11517_c1_seq1:551-1318(-)
MDRTVGWMISSGGHFDVGSHCSGEEEGGLCCEEEGGLCGEEEKENVVYVVGGTLDNHGGMVVVAAEESFGGNDGHNTCLGEEVIFAASLVGEVSNPVLAVESSHAVLGVESNLVLVVVGVESSLSYVKVESIPCFVREVEEVEENIFCFLRVGVVSILFLVASILFLLASILCFLVEVGVASSPCFEEVEHHVVRRYHVSVLLYEAVTASMDDHVQNDHQIFFPAPLVCLEEFSAPCRSQASEAKGLTSLLCSIE